MLLYTSVSLNLVHMSLPVGGGGTYKGRPRAQGSIMWWQVAAGCLSGRHLLGFSSNLNSGGPVHVQGQLGTRRGVRQAPASHRAHTVEAVSVKALGQAVWSSLSSWSTGSVEASGQRGRPRRSSWEEKAVSDDRVFSEKAQNRPDTCPPPSIKLSCDPSGCPQLSVRVSSACPARNSPPLLSVSPSFSPSVACQQPNPCTQLSCLPSCASKPAWTAHQATGGTGVTTEGSEHRPQRQKLILTVHHNRAVRYPGNQLHKP